MQRVRLDAENHCYRIQALEDRLRDTSATNSAERRRQEEELARLRRVPPPGGVFAQLGAMVGGLVDNLLPFPVRL